jgi:serine/threonine protein kinase
MRIKVTDFGTAKLLPTSPSAEQARKRMLTDVSAVLTVAEPAAADEMHSRSNSFVGTAQYVSPELLTAKPIPDSMAKDPSAMQSLPPPACADFWAFGCVLYQFICGQTPFRAPNEYLIFQKITRLDYSFPPDFPEDAKDLVRKLLVLDPFERLGARRGVEEIKEHAFFQSIDWATIWTCDVPAIKTGITAPTIFPKQLLVLEESSHDDDASEEDLEDDDHSSLAPPEESDGVAHPRLGSRGDVPPLPDMLPPSPNVGRRRESASSNYVPFPSIANVNSVNSATTIEPWRYRSNNSSLQGGSRPGSIMSGSSRQQERINSNEKNGVVLSEAERSRSRSTSGSRWSVDILSLTITLLILRVPGLSF